MTKQETINEIVREGRKLDKLELQILLDETLKRYPTMEIAGTPLQVESAFLNQLKTLPVRLAP